jgi:hypothetical protein
MTVRRAVGAIRARIKKAASGKTPDAAFGFARVPQIVDAALALPQPAYRDPLPAIIVPRHRRAPQWQAYRSRSALDIFSPLTRA